MFFQPMDERVLVKPIEEKKISELILVPETVKEKPVVGKIVSLGNDRLVSDEIPMSKLVDVGDYIYFCKYAGVDIMVDGIKHLIVSRQEILGKLMGYKE